MEKYKVILEYILKTLSKRKDIPCSWIGGPNIVFMTITPPTHTQMIYRLKEIPIKIPAGLLQQ